MSAPILAEWTGEAFKPLSRHAKQCDAEFAIGERYFLEPHAPRSQASHSHYFAALSEAYKNLPEDQADRWPTVDALRKYALIMSSYRDERTIVADSKAAAQRLASFIKPMDEHAVITVRECVVRVWTAKSQSMKAMGKVDFQASKDAVLAFVSNLIGVSPGELQREAGRNAA